VSARMEGSTSPSVYLRPEINLGFYEMNYGAPIPDVPPPPPLLGTGDTDRIEDGSEAAREVREYLEKILMGARRNISGSLLTRWRRLRQGRIRC